MTAPAPHLPGDRILGRVACGLSAEERAAGRQKLDEFAALLIRIAARQVGEERAASSRTPPSRGIVST